jgi:hypothetical protein
MHFDGEMNEAAMASYYVVLQQLKSMTIKIHFGMKYAWIIYKLQCSGGWRGCPTIAEYLKALPGSAGETPDTAYFL